MAKDETDLFLRRFVDRMPPGKLEETRARRKIEEKHKVYDAEADEVLYECLPAELWAFRPGGADRGGVDLWNVIGRTRVGRVVFIVGRMGGDGYFRLVTARVLVPPAGEDRQLLADYFEMRPAVQEE
jgi:hypothetical protein